MLEFIIGTAIVLAVATAILIVTGHTVRESRKFVVALVFPIGALAALFIPGYDPGLTAAMATLTTACFAPVLVFLDPNANQADASKTVTAAINAGVAVAGYVATVNPSTVAALTMLGGTIVAAYFVWRTPNEPTRIPIEEG